MATDSTLQKIADNLLAQFDKTLLDNSTDFSSCDQILNAAPSEHKGGLESLYCTRCINRGNSKKPKAYLKTACGRIEMCAMPQIISCEPFSPKARMERLRESSKSMSVLSQRI